MKKSIAAFCWLLMARLGMVAGATIALALANELSGEAHFEGVRRQAWVCGCGCDTAAVFRI